MRRVLPVMLCCCSFLAVGAEPTLQETKEYLVENLDLLGKWRHKFEGNTFVFSSPEWVIRVPIADITEESLGMFTSRGGLGFSFKGIKNRKVIKVDGEGANAGQSAYNAEQYVGPYDGTTEDTTRVNKAMRRLATLIGRKKELF